MQTAKVSVPKTSPLYLAIDAVLRSANSLDYIPDVVGADHQLRQTAAQLCRRAADQLESPNQEAHHA